MSTDETHNTSAESPPQSTGNAPGVTAQAIPKPTSPIPATATPTHAVPASPTTPVSATATPIQSIPTSGLDATPTTAQPENPPIPPPPETPQESPNMRLASLSAIFPDFDSGLLESVLDSVDGDEERAADVLLGMSDPNYISQVQPSQRPGQLSQTELDEQLAHRLMLEEQQHSNPSWRARDRPARGSDVTQPSGGQGAGQSGDAMDRFFDSVDKFAETSKKTFTNIFQKVKAKVDEFDSKGNRQQQQEQQQWQGQSQTYYAPNPQPGSAPAPVSTQGYEISSPPAPRPSEPDLQAPQPQRTVPPATTPPPTIDPSRIGMLPKRPVSLIDRQTPPRPPSPRENDELDYVENPFEEGRHR